MISPRLDALGDLLRRYWTMCRAIWDIRHTLAGPERDSDELAFQPAQLELLETPVHPAPRRTMRVLALLALAILLIGALGRLDIVVTASGRFVPGERVKVIQPAMTGVVREVLVRDGEHVQAGQLLVRLDTRQAAADADAAHNSRLDAELAGARAQALLDALATNRPPLVAQVGGASPQRMEESQRLADGAWREYGDQIDSARAELLKREAELDSTRAEIAKLVATAPLARQQADSYSALVADQYVARNDWLDKEQAAVNQEHELAAQRAHARELAAAVAEQRADIASAVSKFRRDQLDELEKNGQLSTRSRDDETKAQTRQALLSLTAPVAGTVQQLSIHTSGGVVTTAQSLMEIVPEDSLEVEAQLQNRDVGFVSVGQRVAVKVEAFPYTRYGYLDGTVTSISNDAVQDKKQGLTFPVRIRVAASRIRVDDNWIALTPGMAVTADIRTGKRSVIGYFLDPLRRTGGESLRER
nr:HlyD family type I secretion periplasmic adaptor subunit [Paraburkholderia silviterrae]